MSLHGVVDLSLVPFETLVGRCFKDSFSDEHLVAEVGHGEPVVLASPAGPRSSLPSKARVRVHVPRLGIFVWVEQLGEDGEQTIRWSGNLGEIDLSTGECDSGLAAYRSESESCPEAKVCELPQGEQVLLEDADRRVRVWIPRLDVCAWVWQRSAEGIGMIKWLSEPREGEPECILRVAVDEASAVPPGVLQRMWQRPTSLRRALVPKTLEKLRVRATDVEALSTPFHLLVSPSDRRIPADLMRELSTSLSDLSLGQDQLGAFRQEVTQRDEIWRDLVDPELCLSGSAGGDASDEESGAEWQAAEADVGADGTVRWASWVNHLDGFRHAALLQALAKLFELALPQLQEVTGHRLLQRRLQVVVRAYEQELKGSESIPYRIAEWHTDGRPREHIVGTAACYVEVEEGLSGGTVEFAGGSDRWLDDPEATHTVQPATGMVLAFSNEMLRHRVNLLRGRGRRRTVAFHVVSPDHRQEPAASRLPRQLRSQCAEEIFTALLPMRMPSSAALLVARFAAVGISVEEAVEARRQERRSRLTPRLVRRTTGMAFRRRRTTGIWRDDLPISRGTGIFLFSTGTSDEAD